MTFAQFLNLIGIGWLCSLAVDFQTRGLTFPLGSVDRPEWEVRALMQSVVRILADQMEAICEDKDLQFMAKLLGGDFGGAIASDEVKYKEQAEKMRALADNLTTEITSNHIFKWAIQVEVARRMLKW